ncbi:MAG TPA: right-handed parallel beta-helix repeat-containing protein, partial [Pirellulales bacterium]
PGQTPILDFHGEASGKIGLSISTNGWNVKGLTIEYAQSNGLQVSGSNNVVNQIVTRLNQNTGLAIQSPGGSGLRPSNNLILNCDSYGNYDVANLGENADGFTAKFRGLGTGNTFNGCRSFNNADDGFDFWGAESGVTVENCWSFHNAIASSFIGVTGTFAGDGNGIKLGHDSGTHVLKNMLIFGNQGSDGNGIDINGNAFADPGSSGIPSNPYIAINHGVSLFNNTIFNNKGSNFHIDENPQDAATNGTPATTHVLVNNISLNISSGGTVTNNVSIKTGNTENHNSWDSGFGVTASDFISTTDPVTSDGIYHPVTDKTGATSPTFPTGLAVAPRNADGSLPSLNGFLQLKPGDHLIDKGVPTFTSGGPSGFTTTEQLAYSGSGVDLGAFEVLPVRGDFNHDGNITSADLDELLKALVNPAGYQASHSISNFDWPLIADVNNSGSLDNADIQAMLYLMNHPTAGAAGLGDGGGPSSVPEPSALVLVAIGVMLIAARTAKFRIRDIGVRCFADSFSAMR